MPVVTVQMAVPPTPALEGELIGACSHAFARGPCVLGDEREPPGITATVRAEDPAAVEISVGQIGQTRRLRLVFDAKDPDNERYKAIGYAIGSAARSVLEEHDQRAVSGASASSGGPVSLPTMPGGNAPAPTSLSVSASSPLSLELHLEPHFNAVPMGDRPTYGGGLGLSAHFARTWVAFIAVRCRTGGDGENGVLLWNVESLAGVGYGWLGQHIGLELRGGVALVWQHVSIDPGPPRGSASGSRTVVGGWAEGLLLIAPRRTVSGLLGAGFIAHAPTDIYVDGQPQVELRSWEFGVVGGLRIRVF